MGLQDQNSEQKVQHLDFDKLSPKFLSIENDLDVEDLDMIEVHKVSEANLEVAECS
jgi:hypothetical protein